MTTNLQHDRTLNLGRFYEANIHIIIIVFMINKSLINRTEKLLNHQISIKLLKMTFLQT